MGGALGGASYVGGQVGDSSCVRRLVGGGSRVVGGDSGVEGLVNGARVGGSSRGGGRGAGVCLLLLV